MSNRVKAIIAIVPAGYNVDDVAKASPNLVNVYNKAFSNAREIKVNRENGGDYIVVYKDEDFKQIHPKTLMDNFVNLFIKNIQNTVIDVHLQYMYDEQVFNMLDEEVFDPAVAKLLLLLDQLFVNLNNEFISYHRVISFNAMINDYQDWVYDHDEDGSNDEVEEQHNKYAAIPVRLGDEEQTIKTHSSIFGIPIGGDELSGEYDEYGEYGEYDEYDDDENEAITEIERILGGQYSPKKHSKGDTKKSYGHSKVLRNADNAKKNIHRHGVVIADSKQDIRHDTKLIKEFLKDFIPGNQGWKKEFRDELLKRWMSTYCLTRKNIKKLEKHHRNKNRQKHSNINTNRTLEFTKKLLSMPLDIWDNPNK